MGTGQHFSRAKSLRWICSNRRYDFQVSGSTANGVHSNKVYAADITPPMDLYYREANASGTITLDKLSTDVAGEFANSTAVSVPVGLVTAVDYNDDNPSDHVILERTDRNASHQWEEMAPVSVARYAYDGVEVLDGKIYFAGGYNNSAQNLLEEYDPSTDSWQTLAPMSQARSALAAAVLHGKYYAIGKYRWVEIYDPSTDQWSTGTAPQWRLIMERRLP